MIAPPGVHEERDLWVSRALDGDLDTGERESFYAHLGECPECASAYRESRALLAAVQKLSRPQMPDELRLWGQSQIRLPRPSRQRAFGWPFPVGAFATAAAAILALCITLIIQDDGRTPLGGPPPPPAVSEAVPQPAAGSASPAGREVASDMDPAAPVEVDAVSTDDGPPQRRENTRAKQAHGKDESRMQASTVLKSAAAEKRDADGERFAGAPLSDSAAPPSAENQSEPAPAGMPLVAGRENERHDQAPMTPAAPILAKASADQRWQWTLEPVSPNDGGEGKRARAQRSARALALSDQPLAALAPEILSRLAGRELVLELELDAQGGVREARVQTAAGAAEADIAALAAAARNWRISGTEPHPQRVLVRLRQAN